MEKTHHGSCTCGRVRIEARIDLAKGATRCNCRLCTKVHQSSAMVRPEDFRLLEGEDALVTYQRTTYPLFRRFCRDCGAHVYGYGNLPELGGDFVAVNVQCLDDVELTDVPIRYWDGRHDNWHAGPRERPWPMLTPTAA